MSLLANPASSTARISVRAGRSRSLAERAAAEAFVHLMHRCRVRQYDIAAESWMQADDRPVAGGTSREIVRHYRLAPPFWPLTIKSDEPALTGFGVNAHAVVIRYAERTFPLSGPGDGFTAVRTQFGPGCREVLRRATGTNPSFICEPLSPLEAEEVVRAHLIDAAMALAEGRGPLVTRAPNA
ncbi:hypothetical protein [Mycobacterium sp. MMS18-G62]